MKRFLLTLTLFFTVTAFTFAQEKQSDATWEETIDFINSKKEYFKYTMNFGEREIKINSQNITSETYWSGGMLRYNKPYMWEKAIQSAPLKNLKEVRDFKESEQHIYLSFTGNYVTEKIYEAKDDDFTIYSYKGSKYTYKKTKEEDTFYGLYVPDIEMRERIIKAFQHLTYLAIQKREAERKASGDKF